MRWNIIFIIIIGILLAQDVLSFRIGRPPILSLPLTKDQISQLNDFNESIFYLQQGEFNFDIETTPKTNAKNGDMWFITGATVKLQFMMNGNVYSINVD